MKTVELYHYHTSQKGAVFTKLVPVTKADVTVYLGPDDARWLGALALCFYNSSGCQDVVHSQIMVLYQLL